MPAAIAEPPPVKEPKPSTPAAPPEPKPATPPPTPPKSPPAPATAPAGTEEDDPWQGLDAAVAGTKAEPKEPVKTAEPKPASKPGEAKVDTTPERKGEKQLREELHRRNEEFERIKADFKAKEEVVAKYEARIAEYEAKGKDTTALAETLKQREKELEEVRSEVRAAKAEMSPEFKEKWDKPFDQAAAYAMDEVTTLMVGKIVEVENEDGTKSTKWQPERKADWKTDFAKLYAIAKENPAAAMEQAHALFGPTANIVLDHIKDLKRLDRNREVAKAEEKAKWKERETAERAQAAQKEIEQQKQQEEYRQAYDSGIERERKRLTEANPEWYSEDPNDPEGNRLLAEGKKLLEEKPKNLNQAMVLAARNRLNAETALRERYRNRLLREENEKLKAELEEARGKKPVPGTRSTAALATPAAEENGDDFAGLEKVFQS